jgi:hypothetical protein
MATDNDSHDGHDAGLVHTKETGNRNATAISENCYHLELNTC